MKKKDILVGPMIDASWIMDNGLMLKSIQPKKQYAEDISYTPKERRKGRKMKERKKDRKEERKKANIIKGKPSIHKLIDETPWNPKQPGSSVFARG